ncbi:MAG: hypothetical protein LW698_12205 [Planctomycetaceae bacterium]|nr:hypothetical protein [Planctomycetaceae bacterium]
MASTAAAFAVGRCFLPDCFGFTAGAEATGAATAGTTAATGRATGLAVGRGLRVLLISAAAAASLPFTLARVVRWPA